MSLTGHGGEGGALLKRAEDIAFGVGGWCGEDDIVLAVSSSHDCEDVKCNAMRHSRCRYPRHVGDTSERTLCHGVTVAAQ